MSVTVRKKRVILNSDELMLARANITYAVENCPVEGGIIDIDGHLSSEGFYKALLEKLRAVQVKPVNELEVSDEELNFLVATADYAANYCPVEGGIMTEEGKFSSKELIQALHDKLESFQGKT
jgi:hypothetical protein